MKVGKDGEGASCTNIGNFGKWKESRDGRKEVLKGKETASKRRNEFN